MHISDLDTPALLVDLDILEANLRRVAAYAREHNFRLRPHTKTHKTPAIARMQLEHGAAGITVAKVSEAEVMLAAGSPDVLVAYPLIGAAKLARLAEVARKTRVTVALDNLVSAKQLSDQGREAGVEFDVLTEVDLGLRRTGVLPDAIVELSAAIAKLPHLNFQGIAFYPGHIKKMDDTGLQALDTLGQTLETVVSDLTRAGLPPKIVSGGSTPALYESHRLAALNEIRPGTYVFNDRNTVECGACSLDDCAATVLTTVVSTRPGQMIIDGGSKTFSSDRLSTTGEATFGIVREAPAAVFHNMMEEHGFLDLTNANGAQFQVGDRVRVIPNHICVAVNLHEQIYGIRGDRVEQTWKVDGRGKLQ